MADLGMFDVGDQVPLGINVTDASGAAANATTVTLTITRPDQTTAPGIVVTNPPAATGQYRYNYTTTQAGLHTVAWSTTSPATAFTDVFDARSFASLVSLAAARNHLNLSATGNDEELRAYLETATEVVEQIVGPCVVRTFTEEIDTDGPVLSLSHFPVLFVTSITPWSGTAYVTADLVVNKSSGLVRLASGSAFYGAPWTVVYTAGRAVVPQRYVQAAKEMTRHLWTTQRGASGPRLATAEEAFVPGMGFSIPRRVLELLEADRVPGIA